MNKLSPHLHVFKPELRPMLSITDRITGSTTGPLVLISIVCLTGFNEMSIHVFDFYDFFYTNYYSFYSFRYILYVLAIVHIFLGIKTLFDSSIQEKTFSINEKKTVPQLSIKKIAFYFFNFLFIFSILIKIFNLFINNIC